MFGLVSPQKKDTRNGLQIKHFKCILAKLGQNCAELFLEIGIPSILNIN